MLDGGSHVAATDIATEYVDTFVACCERCYVRTVEEGRRKAWQCCKKTDKTSDTALAGDGAFLPG
jgi:hypothetical protein